MLGGAQGSPSKVSSDPLAEAHALPRGSLLSVSQSVKRLPEVCGGLEDCGEDYEGPRRTVEEAR